MQFDENTIRTAVRLTSDDNKMLLLNDRFYCELTENQKTREVKPNYCFFSSLCKDESSPTLVQSTSCFVLDTYVGNGHHASQFGELYHFVHEDLVYKHTFALKLSNNVMLDIIDIKVIDKPYPLHKLISLLDKDMMPKDYTLDDYDPMLTLDGVSVVDLKQYGGKYLNLEYYVDGKLYVEVVDFSDVPDGGIVMLNDTSRREVLVNMPCNGGVLDDNNVQQIASLIRDTIRTLREHDAK